MGRLACGCSWVVCLVSVLWSCRTKAETSAEQLELAGVEPLRRWSIGAGPGIALSLDSREEGQEDVVVSSWLMFAELTLEPLYWLTPHVALGLRGAWGFEIGDPGLATSDGTSLDKGQAVWELALAGRYRFERGGGWYVGGNAGAVAIQDNLGDQVATQWAPLVAVAVGHDFEVAPAFALALELGATHAWFTDGGSVLYTPVEGPFGGGAYHYRYGSTTWLGLNLVGRFLL
jgi:hypothetical protein